VIIVGRDEGERFHYSTDTLSVLSFDQRRKIEKSFISGYLE
jgi:hypothetical protein